MSSIQSEQSIKLINQIQKGFEQFSSGDESNNIVENDIDPNELRQVMYSMNLMQRNPFLYNLINSLCAIENVGKITADELISIIDEELIDDKSQEGVKNLFDVFRKPSKQSISFSVFSDVAKELDDTNSEQEIKNLIDKSQMNSKEIDFNEFYEIVKNNNDDNNNLQNEIKSTEIILRNKIMKIMKIKKIMKITKIMKII